MAENIKGKGNMEKNCLLKGNFNESCSIEEAIECVKSFDDVQKYSLDKYELTGTQKRQVIEKLLRSSKTYDEIWGVNECAEVMNYSLTYGQIRRMIDNLVCTAKTEKELKRVGEYARSKNVFELYFEARGEMETAKILGF